MAPLPHSCDRARAWVSLRLDGELSELEGFMLESHLARCEACRAFAADTVGFTTALRTAPLEPPRAARARCPRGAARAARGAVRCRRRARRRASVGLGSLFGALGSGRAHRSPSPPRRSRATTADRAPPSPALVRSDARGLPRLRAAIRAVRHAVCAAHAVPTSLSRQAEVAARSYAGGHVSAARLALLSARPRRPRRGRCSSSIASPVPAVRPRIRPSIGYGRSARRARARAGTTPEPPPPGDAWLTRRTAENVGKVVEIKGVVIDAVFPGQLPEIYNALAIAVPGADGRRRST